MRSTDRDDDTNGCETRPSMIQFPSWSDPVDEDGPTSGTRRRSGFCVAGNDRSSEEEWHEVSLGDIAAANEQSHESIEFLDDADVVEDVEQRWTDHGDLDEVVDALVDVASTGPSSARVSYIEQLIDLELANVRSDARQTRMRVAGARKR